MVEPTPTLTKNMKAMYMTSFEVKIRKSLIVKFFLTKNQRSRIIFKSASVNSRETGILSIISLKESNIYLS
jgi:hypothetical protein